VTELAVCVFEAEERQMLFSCDPVEAACIDCRTLLNLI